MTKLVAAHSKLPQAFFLFAACNVSQTRAWMF